MRPTPKQMVEYPRILRGSRCHMTIADQLVPTMLGFVATIAANFDQYNQVDIVNSAIPVRARNLNVLHSNVRTLKGPIILEATATQLHRTSTVLARFPESRLKITETVAKHDYIISSSAAAAPNGTGGCTSWISSRLTVADVDGCVYYCCRSSPAHHLC